MTEQLSGGKVVEARMRCDRGCDARRQVGWHPCGAACGRVQDRGGHRSLFCEGCAQFSYRPPHDLSIEEATLHRG